MSDDQLMFQQVELLNQIRDELRQSRTGGDGVGAVSGRPGAAHMQQRHLFDRMASGQWMQLDWAEAYRQQIHSSLSGDVLGAIGFSRAPSTMTQVEYQQHAVESLTNRIAGIPGSIIAPGYAGNVNSLAGDINTFSPRFARFGDSAAGPQGFGFGMSASRALSQEINRLAAGDLRMSTQDYGVVARTGMSSGQFDLSSGPNEFMSKMKELTGAISDLTRVTRATTPEIASFAGSLRQGGVVDVGDQRRIIENVSASARVAGLAFGDVAPAAMTAITAGNALGMSAMTSAGMLGSNLAYARNAARGPQAQLIGQIGGSAAFAQSLTSAQQTWAGSTGAQLSILGGGGDFLGSMMTGLSGVGGSVQSASNFLMAQPDIMNALSKDQIFAGMDSQIRTMAQLSGMGEGGIPIAARSLYMQHGMSAMEATAAARRHTAEGRRDMARTALSEGMARSRQTMGLDQDYDYIENNHFGFAQKGFAYLRQGAAGFVNATSNALSPGYSGYYGARGGTFGQQVESMARGISANPLSLDMFLGGNMAGRGPESLTLRGNSAEHTVGMAGGLALGGAAGIGAGAYGWGAGMGLAGALAPFTGGGSLAMYGIALATAGAAGVGAGYLGAAGGFTLGGKIGSGFDPAVNITGQRLQTYRAIRSGIEKGPISASPEQIAAMAKNPDVQAMLMAKAGTRSAGETVQLLDQLNRASVATGVDSTQMAGFLNAAGADLNTVRGFNEFGSATEATKALSWVLPGGASGATVASAEGASALRDYFNAIDSGDPMQEAKVRLSGNLRTKANLSTNEIAGIRKTYLGADSERRASAVAATNSLVQMAIPLQTSNLISGLSSYVTSAADRLGRGGGAIKETVGRSSNLVADIISGNANDITGLMSDDPIIGTLSKIGSAKGVKELSDVLHIPEKTLLSSMKTAGFDSVNPDLKNRLALHWLQNEGNPNEAAAKPQNVMLSIATLQKTTADILNGMSAKWKVKE